MTRTDPVSFYAETDELFSASELTRGPWSAAHQHGGPVAAALSRAVEHAIEGASLQVVRATIELIRPVPIAPLRIAARVLHRGKTVSTIEATAEQDDKLVARANMLLVSTRSIDLPPLVRGTLPEGIPAPESCPPFKLPFELHPIGYHTAMDVRLARAAEDGGRTFVWMKMRHPLLEAEAPSPLVRVMIAVDSTNGVSAVLDPARFIYTNADLVVALGRPPLGEWIGLDAITRPERTGIGLSDAEIFDRAGPIGRAFQSLVIAPIRSA